MQIPLKQHITAERMKSLMNLSSDLFTWTANLMTVVICFRLKMQDCPFESGTCPYGITFDRNYEDILLEAESAKLGDTTTYSNSIVCAASSAANETPTASIESFKIFQLSEQQTQMLLSNSSSFTIKTGPENDNCMVFTDDKSFTIRSSETSNSLLFLSNLYPSTSEICIPFVSLVELASISSKCRKRFKSRQLCFSISCQLWVLRKVANLVTIRQNQGCLNLSSIGTNLLCKLFKHWAAKWCNLKNMIDILNFRV